MIRPKVSIVGTEAMVRKLKFASEKVRRTVEKIVLATAYNVHNDAKYMCPVDTGRLRGSISVNWTDSGMGFGNVKGVAEPADGVGQPPKAVKGFNAAVGTNVEYAEPVEGRSPYLWPAFAMNKAKFMALMAAALRMELATI